MSLALLRSNLLKTMFTALERIKKYCSHSDFESEDAVFLVFGVVSAQSQGFANLLLRQSLAKTQKSSRRIGYSIFLTALGSRMTISALTVELAFQHVPAQQPSPVQALEISPPADRSHCFARGRA